MTRRLIDLTTPITTNHFRWPVERKTIRSFENGDTFQVTWAGWVAHAFTHMDAARHFDPTGATTDDVPLEQTIGDGVVVDVSHVPDNEAISENDMARSGVEIREGDIAIVRAGWDERASIDTPEFWTRSPYMTTEASDWLREKGVKAVAFDFPQDRCIRNLVLGDRKPEREENTTHMALLLKGVVMFEYLRNLNAIRRERVTFIGLPIKLPDSDGAPARVVAIEE